MEKGMGKGMGGRKRNVLRGRVGGAEMEGEGGSGREGETLQRTVAPRETRERVEGEGEWEGERWREKEGAGERERFSEDGSAQRNALRPSPHEPLPMQFRRSIRSRRKHIKAIHEACCHTVQSDHVSGVQVGCAGHGVVGPRTSQSSGN